MDRKKLFTPMAIIPPYQSISGKIELVYKTQTGKYLCLPLEELFNCGYNAGIRAAAKKIYQEEGYSGWLSLLRLLIIERDGLLRKMGLFGARVKAFRWHFKFHHGRYRD